MTAYRYERGDSRTVAYRIVKSFILFVSWTCLGMWNEISGPTMNDLRGLVNANYEEISRVFSVRSGGKLVGTLIGGFLNDRFKPHRDIFLTIAMAIAGIGVTTAPFCRALWIMGITFFLQGLGHGILNTGGDPTMIVLWADMAAGPLMLLHSGFGFGAAISPFLATPFLSKNKTVNVSTQWMAMPSGDSPIWPFPSEVLPGEANGNHAVTLLQNISANQSSTRQVLTPTRIQIPYAIIGICCFTIAVTYFVFYFIRIPEIFRKQLYGAQQNAKRLFSPASCTGGQTTFGVMILSLAFIYFFVLVGVERAYGKFMFPYARKSELKFTQADAAWLTAVYWISYTMARIFGFFISQWVPVQALMFVWSFGVSGAAIFLTIFRTQRVPFWIFSTLFGFFKSPIFPACIGYLNRYMEVTAMVVVAVNIGGALGGMFMQWFTGYLFQNYGPSAFMYLVLVCSLLITLVFCMMHVVARRHGDRFKNSASEKDSDVKLSTTETSKTSADLSISVETISEKVNTKL